MCLVTPSHLISTTHPLQYQLLMAEGIIALAPGNIWSYLVTRRTKILLHWLLQVVGGVFSIVGVWFEYKGRSAGRHLNNMHEMLGFVSIVFLCITIVNGVANLYNQELAKWIRPVYQKAFHNVLGIVTFVLGMVSIYYSYNFRWVKNLMPDAMRHTLEIITIITLVLSLFAALRALYFQMKQMLSKDE